MLYTFVCINCKDTVTERLDYRVVEVMLVLGGACDYCCKVAYSGQTNKGD